MPHPHKKPETLNSDASKEGIAYVSEKQIHSLVFQDH